MEYAGVVAETTRKCLLGGVVAESGTAWRGARSVA
jgi:hypothetical protein